MKHSHFIKIVVRFFLIGLIILMGENGFSQSGIFGKVTDQETGEEMIAANVQVSQKGVFVYGETTDIDGDFRIRLEPGTYEVIVSYTGYQDEKITEVKIEKEVFTRMDITLEGGIRNDDLFYLECYGGRVIPLINHEKTSTGKNISSEKIKNLPTRNINDIITLTPGLSLTQ